MATTKSDSRSAQQEYVPEGGHSQEQLKDMFGAQAWKEAQARNERELRIAQGALPPETDREKNIAAAMKEVAPDIARAQKEIAEEERRHRAELSRPGNEKRKEFEDALAGVGLGHIESDRAKQIDAELAEKVNAAMRNHGLDPEDIKSGNQSLRNRVVGAAVWDAMGQADGTRHALPQLPYSTPSFPIAGEGAPAASDHTTEKTIEAGLRAQHLYGGAHGHKFLKDGHEDGTLGKEATLGLNAYLKTHPLEEVNRMAGQGDRFAQAVQQVVTDGTLAHLNEKYGQSPAHVATGASLAANGGASNSHTKDGEIPRI